MQKIVNIGSISIDYAYQVPHFVQPGETLATLGRKVSPGGKGLNQSVALALAGAPVYHAGRVGPDGGETLAVLEKAGASLHYMDRDGSATGNAIIQVDPSGQNCIFLFAGANHELTEGYIDGVLGDFSAGDILLLQNEMNLLGHCIQQATARGMLVALNPSPITPELKSLPLASLHWLILNEIEAAELSGEAQPAAALRALRQQCPGTAVVLTMGQNGVLYDDGKTTCSHGIYKANAVDTTAAGDTFTGYFLASILKGEAPEEALRLASLASAITVTRAGASAAIPALEEVLACPFPAQPAPALP